MIAQTPPPELLADVDADLDYASVAPAGIHPVQGRPTGDHTAVQHHQPTVLGVGGIPRSVGRTIGLKGRVLGGDPL